ncbi:MAG TPA: alpha/beta fold hydrolase [Acidimicrobiales bacterium]|nr:alpha/beta fold hydrolase [Acidimicrobiales bacterium]
MSEADTVNRGTNPDDFSARYRRDPEAFWLSWKTIVVSGRSVAYGEAGDGVPVLFLHGWGLDHRAYKRSLARLVARGVRVVAPALPGFGGSEPLPPQDSTLAGFAKWSADLLDALKITEPALIMGHSFGGGVAIVLAHDFPERVRGLVLINSIGASAWAQRGVTARTITQRPLWDWGLHFPGDLWPLRQARRVLPVILSEALPNLLREPQAFWRVAALARGADLIGELQELKRRRLPVVVLWGSRDRIITRDAFEEMCEVLGTPHSLTIEGSHAWLIADPDTFGEVITNVVDIAFQASTVGRSRRKVRQLPSLARRLRRHSPTSGRTA